MQVLPVGTRIAYHEAEYSQYSHLIEYQNYKDFHGIHPNHLLGIHGKVRVLIHVYGPLYGSYNCNLFAAYVRKANSWRSFLT